MGVDPQQVFGVSRLRAHEPPCGAPDPSEPAELWEHFYRITQIPRPSAEEAAVRRYVSELADRAGYPCRTDAAGNLVVYVPGSMGRESEAPVIIQNHLEINTVVPFWQLLTLLLERL